MEKNGEHDYIIVLRGGEIKREYDGKRIARDCKGSHLPSREEKEKT